MLYTPPAIDTLLSFYSNNHPPTTILFPGLEIKYLPIGGFLPNIAILREHYSFKRAPLVTPCVSVRWVPEDAAPPTGYLSKSLSLRFFLSHAFTRSPDSSPVSIINHNHNNNHIVDYYLV